jgi:hypothetical protein
MFDSWLNGISVNKQCLCYMNDSALWLLLGRYATEFRIGRMDPSHAKLGDQSLRNYLKSATT